MAYKVDASGIIRQRIRQLLQEAIAAGQEQEFRTAYAALVQELQANPFAPGEIKYHLESGIPVHSVARAPVMMTVAIHVPAQVVWIVTIDRMFASGESPPSEP